MFAADAIDMGRQPHGKCRHVEAVARAFRCIAEAQKFFSGQAELIPIVRKITVHEMEWERYRVRRAPGCAW